MRAVLCNGFDGIKALSIGEAAEPRPGADEILIDVHAACVSFADYLMICGGLSEAAGSPLRTGNGCRRGCCRLRQKRSAVSSR